MITVAGSTFFGSVVWWARAHANYHVRNHERHCRMSVEDGQSLRIIPNSSNSDLWTYAARLRVNESARVWEVGWVPTAVFSEANSRNRFEIDENVVLLGTKPQENLDDILQEHREKKILLAVLNPTSDLHPNSCVVYVLRVRSSDYEELKDSVRASLQYRLRALPRGNRSLVEKAVIGDIGLADEERGPAGKMTDWSEECSRVAQRQYRKPYYGLADKKASTLSYITISDDEKRGDWGNGSRVKQKFKNAPSAYDKRYQSVNQVEYFENSGDRRSPRQPGKTGRRRSRSRDHLISGEVNADRLVGGRSGDRVIEIIDLD